MSAWQSFIVAWAAVQIIPAVASEPTYQNITGGALFLATFVTVFMGLNAVSRWVREFFIVRRKERVAMVVGRSQVAETVY